MKEEKEKMFCHRAHRAHRDKIIGIREKKEKRFSHRGHRAHRDKEGLFRRTDKHLNFLFIKPSVTSVFSVAKKILIFVAIILMSSFLYADEDTEWSNIFSIDTMPVWSMSGSAMSSVAYFNSHSPGLAGSRLSNAIAINTWTTGWITGRIYEDRDLDGQYDVGEEIIGARIYVVGYPWIEATSGYDGTYSLPSLPEGISYTLCVIYSGFRTEYLFDVDISGGGSNSLDIKVVPYGSGTYRLQNITPDPHDFDNNGTPDPMKIMRGGIGYRYYRVVDSAGVPCTGIPVKVDCYFNKQFTSGNLYGAGVVRIEIYSLDAYDGQTVTITHLNGVALAPADQKSFIVDIEDLDYRHRWEMSYLSSVGANAGIGGMAEKEGMLGVELRERQLSNPGPEDIYITRQALLGAGVTASLSVGKGKVQVLGFGGSAQAGFGGSITVGKSSEDIHVFNYNSSVFDEKLSKLDLLLYPLEWMPSILKIISLGIQSSTLDSYKYENTAGIYLKGAAEAYADLELGLTRNPAANLGIDAGGSIGASLKAEGFYTNNMQESRKTIGVTITGAGYVEIGKFATVTWGSNKILEPWDKQGLFEATFALEFDYDNRLKAAEVSLLMETQEQYWLYESEAQLVTYRIVGSDTTLKSLVNTSAIFAKLWSSVAYSPISKVRIDTGIVRQDLITFFDRAVTLMDSLNITYEKLHIPSRGFNVPIFDIDVEVLGVGIGGNLQGGLKESRVLPAVTGKVVRLHHYPLAEYDADVFPDIGITLGNVYGKAFSDVGKAVWGSFVNTAQQVVQGVGEFIMSAGNSIIRFGQGVVSVGTTITNTYGTTGQQKALMALALNGEETTDSDYFKIGGIYKFDPDGLELTEPGELTILYDEAELGAFAESSLAMYMLNTETGKWEYLGGAVDTVNNSVTATITHLGSFTLAPRIPYGEFDFTPANNTTPADGTSILSFTSETLLNNDGTTVSDGMLFTLTSSHATIVNTDEDGATDGIQVSSSGGIITAFVQAPEVGIEVTVTAKSLVGVATVTGAGVFIDDTPPSAPMNVTATVENEKIIVRWDANTEIDLAGYKIYFDNDASGAPYLGYASYIGVSSPIEVGITNEIILNGLKSGMTYYIVVTACDISGNESQYSIEASVLSPAILDADGDGMPNDWELQYSIPTSPDVLPLDPVVNDGLLDNDGDGKTNYQEYLDGTDPTSAESVFKIVSVAMINSTTVEISWGTGLNKTYQLYYCNDYTPYGTWNPLGDPVFGTGGTVSIQDTGYGTRRYYKIGTQ